MNRRAFVGLTAGAAAAGAGVALGPSFGPSFMPGLLAQGTQGSGGTDLVWDELKRQFKEANGRTATAGAAAMRQMASVLRLFAAHVEQHGLDQLVRQSVQRAVRRRGRAAVLQADSTHDRMLVELKAWGLSDAQLERVHAFSPTPADRERALDSLLTGPSTIRDLYQQAAAQAESVAASLERLDPVMRRAAARQSAVCESIWRGYEIAINVANTLCAAVGYGSYICAAALGSAAGVLVSYYLCTHNFF